MAYLFGRSQTLGRYSAASGKNDRFVSIAQFESLCNLGKILSLSFWRDERAAAKWHSKDAHRRTQAVRRSAIFADYPLCIAIDLRDYGLFVRAQVPVELPPAHDNFQPAARFYRRNLSPIAAVTKWMGGRQWIRVSRSWRRAGLSEYVAMPSARR